MLFVHIIAPPPENVTCDFDILSRDCFTCKGTWRMNSQDIWRL